MDPQALAQTLGGAQLDPNYEPGLLSPITIAKMARLLLPGYALTHPEDAMGAVNSAKGAAQSVVQALTAPHRAYTGELPVMATDPNTGETHTTPEAINEGMNFGLTTAVGGGLVPEEAAVSASSPMRAARRLYHGTDNPPDAFLDTTERGDRLHEFGGGVYTTDNPDYAASFGNSVMPLDVQFSNPVSEMDIPADYRYGPRAKAWALQNGHDAIVANKGNINGVPTQQFMPLQPGSVTSAIDGTTLYSNRAQPPLLAMMRGRKPVLESDIPAEPTPVAAENAPPFYSAVQSAVENAPQAKAPGPQWLGMLKNAPGIKPEELDWLGMNDFLNKGAVPPQAELMQRLNAGESAPTVPQTFTKDQLLAHILQNKPEINDVLQGPPIEAPKAPKAKPNTSPVTDQEIADVLERARTEWPALRRDLATSYGESTDTANPRFPNSDPLLDRIMADPSTIDPHIQRQALEEAALQLRKVEPKVDVQDVSQPEGLDTKYQQYTMPGGKNYRELLLTMPEQKSAFQSFRQKMIDKYGRGEWRNHMTPDEQAERTRLEDLGESSPPVYKSGHFDAPNILAHVRFKDRVDANGKKTLAIEEIQSDWHQAGRKSGYKSKDYNKPAGFREWAQAQGLSDAEIMQAIARADHDPTYAAWRRSEYAVPDAPFKTTWHELALKRMMRWAAEHGYDQIAWTPGEVQNARYRLSHHVDRLQYFPGGKTLVGFKNGNEVVTKHGIEPEALPDYVGNEVANKLLDESNQKPPYTIKQDTNRLGGPVFRLINGADGHTIQTFATQGEAERQALELRKQHRDFAAPFHELSGQDLDIGGSGMKGFYDQMLPKAANKLGKKYGAQVGTGQFFDPAAEAAMKEEAKRRFQVFGQGRRWYINDQAVPGEVRPESDYFTTRKAATEEMKRRLAAEMAKAGKHKELWTLPITPAMREQAMTQGFPMFANRAPKELATMLQGNNNQ